ncbi:ATP-binding protein [Streptomyces prunicolor]|uniref:ATP-binding protein n=1 Tax=Streptomyces prunicolor TaxID=67348 RepID=UPI000694FD2F|nr:ATP-binding protein [Streptomyces prunicolor]
MTELRSPAGVCGVADTSCSSETVWLGSVGSLSACSSNAGLASQYGENSTKVPDLLNFPLARARSQARVARHMVGDWLLHRCHMPGDRVEMAEFIVSELVTNAILYGKTPTVAVRAHVISDASIRVEIDNFTLTDAPHPERAGQEAESGRGLFLVDCLITQLGGSWGYVNGGTVVRCDLPIQSALEVADSVMETR